MPDVPAARTALAHAQRTSPHRSEPCRASTHRARARHLPRSSRRTNCSRVLHGRGLRRALPRAARLRARRARRPRSAPRVLQASRLARLAHPLSSGSSPRRPCPSVAQLAVLSGSDVSYVGQAAAPRAPTTVVARRRAPARAPHRDRARDARRAARRAGARALPAPRRPDHPHGIGPGDPRRARRHPRRDARARLGHRGRRDHGRVRLRRRRRDRPHRLPGRASA